MTEKSKIILVYVFTLAGIILCAGLIFAAPYLKSRHSALSTVIYVAFSAVCHQIPSRSFHVLGYPLAVCARCLGIYAGFFTGCAAYAFRRGFVSVSFPRTRTFLLLSLPLISDAAGNILQIWTSPLWLRFMTGSLWGFILPFYFIAGLADFFLRIHRGKKQHESPETQLSP